MRDLEQTIVNVDIRIELLANLAAERVGVRFSRVHLAARKFPQPFEVRTGVAPCQEELAVLFDDGSNDGDGGQAYEPPAVASSARRTRSASCAGVNGFCKSGTPPQNAPCTAVASSVYPDM